MKEWQEYLLSRMFMKASLRRLTKRSRRKTKVDVGLHYGDADTVLMIFAIIQTKAYISGIIRGNTENSFMNTADSTYESPSVRIIQIQAEQICKASGNGNEQVGMGYSFSDSDFE